MRLLHVCVVSLLSICASASVGVAQEPRVLFQFDNAQRRGAWSNVNDGVMGGVSVGRYGMTPEGNLRFFGRLSLANNGGFASVRSRGPRLGLAQDDVLWLRIRGDGRKYNLDVRTPSNRMASTYRVALQTKVNEWQEFRVPVKTFVATSFGRVVSNARPVTAAEVNSIGFTISDKVPGPFQLDVAWIRVTKKAS